MASTSILTAQWLQLLKIVPVVALTMLPTVVVVLVVVSVAFVVAVAVSEQLNEHWRANFAIGKYRCHCPPDLRFEYARRHDA